MLAKLRISEMGECRHGQLGTHYTSATYIVLLTRVRRTTAATTSELSTTTRSLVERIGRFSRYWLSLPLQPPYFSDPTTCPLSLPPTCTFPQHRLNRPAFAFPALYNHHSRLSSKTLMLVDSVFSIRYFIFSKWWVYPLRLEEAVFYLHRFSRCSSEPEHWAVPSCDLKFFRVEKHQITVWRWNLIHSLCFLGSYPIASVAFWDADRLTVWHSTLVCPLE